MKKILFFVLILCIVSCGGAKYSYSIEKGTSVDFSQGKWILNEVYGKDNSRLYNDGLRDFKEILGDSLFEMYQAKNLGSGIMKAQMPFHLTKDDMMEIKKATSCDYIIHIKARVLKDEMDSFISTSDNESVIKENSAKVDIKIFDLKNGELLSNYSVVGKDVRKLTENSSSSFVSLASSIKSKALYKLIKKYEKNRILK